MIENDPELGRKLQSVEYVKVIHNLICEAQELDLSIPWDAFDVQTISLVAELRREQRKLESKKKGK